MQRLITLFRAKRGERTLLNNLLAFSPLLPPAGMVFDFHFLFYILFFIFKFCSKEAARSLFSFRSSEAVFLLVKCSKAQLLLPWSTAD